MYVLDCIGYLSRFGVAPAASLFGFLHLYAGMMQTLWLGQVSCFNIYQYVEILPPPGRGKNILKNNRLLQIKWSEYTWILYTKSLGLLKLIVLQSKPKMKVG